MLDFQGKRVNKKDFGEPVWVEDFVYFEGPLVSLMKGSTTQDYIYAWCDSDMSLNRWLVIPVDRTGIFSYLEGQTTLSQFISGNNNYYLADIDGEYKHHRIWSVVGSDIPLDYLPSNDSYFDSDLCPSGHSVLEKPSRYKIHLDQRWFFEELASVPKMFVELYSFAYALKNMSRPSVANACEKAFGGYPWRGGSSAVHFYKDLSKAIPSMHEPQVREIQYASPGHIELELLSDVSADVALVVDSYSQNQGDIELYVKEIKRFLKDNGYSQIREFENLPVLSKEHKDYLKRTSRALLEMINLSNHVDSIFAFSGHHLVGTKISLSFIRRLQKLIPYKEKGMIRL